VRISALETFVELSEAESFRQLAHARVKPALSAAKSKGLEYYFRTELFDRNAEGISLTESGRLLLGHAHQIQLPCAMRARWWMNCAGWSVAGSRSTQPGRLLRVFWRG
jgi:DNA-binding transcriptional LysR family regulator